MPDEQLDIAIRVLADTHGAKAVEQALRKVTEESKKSTEGTKAGTKAIEDQSKQVKGLKESLSMLTTALGPVGYMLKNVFVSTGAAAIGALAVVLTKVVQHFQKMAAISKALAEGVPQDMAAIAKAVDDVNQKTREAAVSTKKWEEALSESTQNKVDDLQAEQQALLEVIKARMALAVAAGADADETQKKLIALESEFGLEGKLFTLAQRRNELAGLTELEKRRRSEAAAGLGGQTVGQARESIAFLESSGQGLNAQIANLEKLRDAASGGQRAEIDVRLSGLRQLRDKDIVRMRTLRGGISAFEEAESLGGRIAERSRTIGRLETSVGAGEQSARLRNVSGMLEGVAAVDLVGGRAQTPVAMQQELQTVVRALAESKMETEQLIRLLTTMFKDGIVNKAELKALNQALADQRRY